jgi:hypothetical protein
LLEAQDRERRKANYRRQSQRSVAVVGDEQVMAGLIEEPAGGVGAAEDGRSVR